MLRSLTALLVEDDARLARFTADYLADHEVSVTHAGDGEAALIAFARHRFDAIVLDVVLPKRSGLAALPLLQSLVAPFF